MLAVRLYASHKWLLTDLCAAGDDPILCQNDDVATLTTREWNEVLRKWDVTGVPEELKASQAYTDVFGYKIVRFAECMCLIRVAMKLKVSIQLGPFLRPEPTQDQASSSSWISHPFEAG